MADEGRILELIAATEFNHAELKALLTEINERLIDLELDRMLFDMDKPYHSYLTARDEARQRIKDRYG